MVGGKTDRKSVTESGVKIRKTSSRPKTKNQTRPTRKNRQKTTRRKTQDEKRPSKTAGKKTSKKSEQGEETITRQFGLTPRPYCPYCKTLGQKTHENGKQGVQCPSCYQLVDGEPRIPSDVFSRVQKVVNGMIRRGRHLPLKYLSDTGVTAPKKFYNRIIKDPQVKKLTKQSKLHNRVHRCAAQYAYFSLQEYGRRQVMVRELMTVLKAHLASSTGLAELGDPTFPSYSLLKEGQRRLRRINEQRPPLELLTDSVSIRNMLRHLRNLLQKDLQARSADPNTLADFQGQSDPVWELTRLMEDLKGQLPELAKQFLRRLSSHLTRRVKHLRQGQGPDFGQGFWDHQIKEILGQTPPLTTKGRLNLPQRTWERHRKRWRDQLIKTLAQPTDQVLVTLFPAVQRILDRVPPSSILINRLFHRSRSKFWSTGDVMTDWTRFLIFHLRQTIVDHRVDQYRPFLHQCLKATATEMITHSRTFLKVPVFSKQSISLAQDDNYIYELYIDQAPVNPTEEDPSSHPGRLVVRLTLESRSPRYYYLNTPDRFFELLAAGFQPLRPVLLKRPAGGASVLAIPFNRPPAADLSDPTQATQNDSCPPVVNVDLGLKTLATISVTQGVTPVPLDPRYASAEDLQEVYADAHLEHFELARYFLDQAQLHLSASTWHHPPRVPFSKPTRFFNYKRRLTNLRTECRDLHQKLARCRRHYRPKYRHKTQYFQLRREWKRKWKKIRQLHQEMARQVATRLVHLALHHQATTIRFEDLRWAQHSPKDGVGTWLATWQVHWFHGEIIRRTQALAARYHLSVDLVYAAYTSQRCSSCGAHGTSDGKLFRCPHCNRQLDRDLNAARNIALAPLSPEAICFGSGPPFPSGNSGGLSSECPVAPQ